MSLGGMQLIPAYKHRLDPRFLTWYLSGFTSRRMGYIHWSAGPRSLNFDDYHMVVTEDAGAVATHHNTPCGQDLHAHTFQRNTDSWACCVASMQNGTTDNLGPQAPTPEQMRHLVAEVAQVCCNLRQPVADLMTHAEAADNVDGAEGLDFYGPHNGCERWDWWVWVSPESLRMVPCTHAEPAGWIYWPDWFRGEVILHIQELTRAHWAA